MIYTFMIYDLDLTVLKEYAFKVAFVTKLLVMKERSNHSTEISSIIVIH